MLLEGEWGNRSPVGLLNLDQLVEFERTGAQGVAVEGLVGGRLLVDGAAVDEGVPNVEAAEEGA